MEFGSNKIGQKWINTCFFGRDIIKLHTEKYTETDMNIYANRAPEIPNPTVKNISTRLVGIINGSDMNEIQGERLLELCKECWGAGWQYGYLDTGQPDPIENASNYGGTD